MVSRHTDGRRGLKSPRERRARAALLFAAGGIGGVVAVLAAAVLWPAVVGPLAAIAIGTIGSIVGSVLTILPVLVKDRR